jgi:hypothetical protein
MFLDYFDDMMLKIIFNKKKYYFIYFYIKNNLKNNYIHNFKYVYIILSLLQRDP